MQHPVGCVQRKWGPFRAYENEVLTKHEVRELAEVRAELLAYYRSKKYSTATNSTASALASYDAIRYPGCNEALFEETRNELKKINRRWNPPVGDGVHAPREP